MKNQKFLLTLTVACLAIASSAAKAQTLINFNIDPTGGNGLAVLGGTMDTYNTFGSGDVEAAAPGGTTTTLVTNAVSSTNAATGVAISTSTGFNTFTDANGTTANPAFLMDGYAYTASKNTTAVTGPLNFTFSGLTAYDGDSFTLVVYAAGNGAGNGDLIGLSGASTDAASTSGTDRDITKGVGDAYQEFMGTISGDVLSITAAANDPNDTNNQGPFTEVNGLQLQLTPAAGAIPEPSTWAMMIGGFGLLVAMGRFRSRLQA